MSNSAVGLVQYGKMNFIYFRYYASMITSFALCSQKETGRSLLTAPFVTVSMVLSMAPAVLIVCEGEFICIGSSSDLFNVPMVCSHGLHWGSDEGIVSSMDNSSDHVIKLDQFLLFNRAGTHVLSFVIDIFSSSPLWHLVLL